ncbi:MAG: hypothetical protein Q8W44_05650 [Candidatus Palauibacterales bacterium]|nr:hypothetical protein [Candidatus Palauibacterales bacterium]
MQLLDPAAWSTLGVDVFVFLVLKGVPLSLGLLLARRVLDGYGAGTRAAAWSLGVLGLAVLPFLQLELSAWGAGVVEYPESWLEAMGGGWPIGTWLLLIWGSGAVYLLGRFAGSKSVDPSACGWGAFPVPRSPGGGCGR